jgi:phasin
MMRRSVPRRAARTGGDFGFMLLLLLRNMMWAAWWPYCTMMLAMEKAAEQRERAKPQSPPQRQASQPAQERGKVRPEENPMASDTFIKAEVPEALRELMKMSIEQAKRAFETFVSTSEKTWKSLEASSPSGRAGLFALNAKIAEITRHNAEANFALAMRLAEAKDVAHAIELQSEHMRKQMETFVQQLEEMRDLTAQMIQEAHPATRTDVGSARAAASPASNVRRGPGSSFASYAPSSSITPGGRSY